MDLPTFTTRGGPSRAFAQGLTAMDLLIVVALVAASATMALPSLTRLIETRQLHGVAHELRAALGLARSGALARQERVSVSLQTTVEGRQCLLVHTGPAQACECRSSGAASCQSGAQALQAAIVLPASRISMRATADAVHFDPRAGTATPAGRFVVRTSSGREVQQVISLTGRVRSCTLPQAEQGLLRCPAN